MTTEDSGLDTQHDRDISRASLQREKEKNGMLEQEKKLAQHCHRTNDAFKRILQTDKMEELKI